MIRFIKWIVADLKAYHDEQLYWFAPCPVTGWHTPCWPVDVDRDKAFWRKRYTMGL